MDITKISAILIIIASSFTQLASANQAEKFVQAIDSSNLSRLTVLLRSIDDINQVRISNRSLLEYAVSKGNIEVAKFLIDKGHSTASLDSALFTSLKSVTGSRFLLSLGANPNTRINGVPLIHLATEQGNLEILSLLINSGARVNVNDSQGKGISYRVLNTPKNNRQQIFDLLVRNGASYRSQNEKGQTLLHEFAISGDNEALSFYLNQGIDKNVKDQAGNAFSYYLLTNDKGHETIQALRITNIDLLDKVRATTPAALNGQAMALKNLLLDTEGKFNFEVDSELLIQLDLDVAYVLHKFANQSAGHFLAGRSYYEFVVDHFDYAYFLLDIGYVPDIQGIIDMSNLAAACEVHDMMPVMLYAGFTAKTRIESIGNENSMQGFLEENCSANQSFAMTKQEAIAAATPHILSSEEKLRF